MSASEQAINRDLATFGHHNERSKSANSTPAARRRDLDTGGTPASTLPAAVEKRDAHMVKLNYYRI